jgi:hypothetical protein
MAMSGDEEVANKQVILKNYVISGLPKKSDVEEIASTIKLKVPKETPGIHGVARALDSGHPDYRKGDLIWEEQSHYRNKGTVQNSTHRCTSFLLYWNSWFVFFFFCI